MNTKHAQYMLTVLQEGNITNAAKKLYISQPSLSQMIKLVEKNLNAPIFNRSTDPITLTYAGIKYIEAAEKILTINNNLDKEISEINMEDHGHMKIGCSVQRGLQMFPYTLPKFMKLYPNVELEVIEHGSATLETIALDGKLDLAMVTTSPKFNALEYVLIENEHPVLIANKNSPIAKRIPDGTYIDITEARNEIFISLKKGHSIRTIQERLFFKYDLSPKILMESNNIEVSKRTAIACNGVMICPDNYIEKVGDFAATMVRYPLNVNEYDRHFYLCYRKDLYLTKYMKAFIDIVTSFNSNEESFVV